MLLKFNPPNAIDHVADYIESNALLNMHVLDIQASGDLLVVLTDGDLPSTFVKPLLRRIWLGPVEVYCATDMVTGS